MGKPVKDAIASFFDNHETIKTTGDIAAVSITVGTVVQLLPAVAAVLTIVWTAIRIWETATVQKFVKRLKR